MKKGIVSSPFYLKSREDLSSLLASFDQLAESNMYESVEFYYEGSPEDYAIIGRKLADLKIEPVFHAGFAIKRDKLDLGSSSQQGRESAIDRCIECIDYSYLCGARKMLILSGPESEAHGDMQSYLDRFADSVRKLCNYAKSVRKTQQLEITLEFFNNSGEPYLALGNLDTILDLMARVEDLNGEFGLTYDTSHVIQLGGNLTEYYLELKKYTRHIHFANCVSKDRGNPLFGDKHPPFNISGGDLNDLEIRTFLGIIDSSHTDICSFEIIPSDIYDRDYCLNSLKSSYMTIFS